jgi:NhaA family Na+:H+ antiporter
MADRAQVRLLHDVDRQRDHVRGGDYSGPVVSVVYYGDFLCPYCRRLRAVLMRLKNTIGGRMAYAFRHFPNERAHPGAEFMALAAEAAANQDRFWEMYDALFDQEPPISKDRVHEIARKIGLDMAIFERDIDSEAVRARVKAQLAEARQNGVSGTPTIFIDGVRYDGAWDYYSLLDVLERPVAERIQRSARAFASLPASGGLALILAALAALCLANSPLAPVYDAFIGAPFGIGPRESLLSLSVGAWFSEGLLAFFFLLVGLEIRREMTAGALADRQAATLPIIAAIIASIAPALIYLAINKGGAASGWSVPTATDIAFALGVLALLGGRVTSGLRVFVAAFAVVDDIISVLVLAIFYPRNFEMTWLIGAAAAMVVMFALNRWRVYAIWPYAAMTVAVWYFLHSAGVDGALAGIVLAMFLPTRPAPAAGPLLAQAATALAALEHAQGETGKEKGNPILEWASRNLSAASERLLSPADRVEQSVAPWSTYFILPLFAFSATGVGLAFDLSAPDSARILLGVILGLVIGKPLGVCAASWLATRTHIARMPEGTSLRAFIGAACLCGIGDTMSLLMADQAFPAQPMAASVAKIGVLIGSVLSAGLGALIILTGSPVARTEAISDTPANAGG